MSNNNMDTPGKKQAEEVTLKEVILIIQDYFFEALRNWKIIVVAVILGIVFFLYRAYTTPATYSTNLTFMVNEDESGGIGGAMAILSQFGIGGNSGGKYNLKKILELSKTRKIIELVLFEQRVINDKKDYLANHIINLQELHKKWEKSAVLKDFKFTHDSIPVFSRVENTALKALHGVLIGTSSNPGLYSTSLNDDTGIMSLKMTSLSEELTLHWLDAAYLVLSSYYIDKSIEKQKFTYDIVAFKADSLKQKMESLEFQLAKFKDSNRGIWSQTYSLKQQQLSRDVQMLRLIYAEAMKNLEIADFTLKNKTPFIQLIDTPIPPIKPNIKPPLIAIIQGMIIGGFLAVCFIFGRKILREAMKK